MKQLEECYQFTESKITDIKEYKDKSNYVNKESHKIISSIEIIIRNFFNTFDDDILVTILEKWLNILANHFDKIHTKDELLNIINSFEIPINSDASLYEIKQNCCSKIEEFDLSTFNAAFSGGFFSLKQNTKEIYNYQITNMQQFVNLNLDKYKKNNLDTFLTKLIEVDHSFIFFFLGMVRLTQDSFHDINESLKLFKAIFNDSLFSLCGKFFVIHTLKLLEPTEANKKEIISLSYDILNLENKYFIKISTGRAKMAL